MGYPIFKQSQLTRALDNVQMVGEMLGRWRIGLGWLDMGSYQSINIRAAREAWFYYLSVSINIRAAREAWFYYLSVGGGVVCFFFSANLFWEWKLATSGSQEERCRTRLDGHVLLAKSAKYSNSFCHILRSSTRGWHLSVDQK